ncbi:MAG: hypothetical protein ABF747_02745 [Bifidobacterium sp.]|uniref:alpha-L-rhamnosidase n=2 Tax=Bifidobacterium TaxID=1678 RepID=A0AB39UMI0_9BIFI
MVLLVPSQAASAEESTDDSSASSQSPSSSDASSTDNSDTQDSVQETQKLEQQQQRLDAETTPETIQPKETPAPQLTSPSTGSRSVQDFSTDATEAISDDDASDQESIQGTNPYSLAVNGLREAWNVDRASIAFSWKNSNSQAQQAYQIAIYQGEVAQGSPVFDTGVKYSASASAQELPNLENSLKDSTLYSWKLTVTYGQGAQRSSTDEFATAMGNTGFTDTNFLWLHPASVSTLLRAQVPAMQNGGIAYSKALLTVTALDTEASKRYVSNVYVNGVEVGVGPNRRTSPKAGEGTPTVYYNTFDVTNELSQSPSSPNTVGLYSYSQAKTTGVLVQLSYFSADGTPIVVYNSARPNTTSETTDGNGSDNAAATFDNKQQIMPMDSIVYGTSGQSIGTGYYTELAQNADTGNFPYDWWKLNGSEYSVPRESNGFIDTTSCSASTTSPCIYKALGQMISGNPVLAPSITANTIRRKVSPASIVDLGGGTYTVTFPQEVIGDIQLTSSSKANVRITLGEEISGGKAVYRMRTGNTYSETWKFPSQGTTFAGYSLKAFRYVTLYNYPEKLTADKIQGLQTSIPSDPAQATSFTSQNSLLNSIYSLTQHTDSATTMDTVPDSITRERRPYEGDNLIYQSLQFSMGSQGLESRNTWNWLIDNPSQYTEYGLMPVLGVYQDYIHTGDVQYVRSVYSKLQEILRSGKVIDYDSKLHLVKGASSKEDLVDWPRTETPGFDYENTTYKTAINVFAYEAYANLSYLAGALHNPQDQKAYGDRAAAIKSAILTKLYSSETHTFIDGLNAAKQGVQHTSPQNSYVALAYGVYPSQRDANAIAEKITHYGRQASGSIYSAYFFYQGLYDSGNGDLANGILESTESNDPRTYDSVINKLHATITPEAWSTGSKPNMTFSHPWGSGGGSAMIQGVGGTVAMPDATDQGSQMYRIDANGIIGETVTTTISTKQGQISTKIARTGDTRTIIITIPSGLNAQLRIPKVSSEASLSSDTDASILMGTPSDGVSTTALNALAAGTYAFTVTDPEQNQPPEYESFAGDSLAARRNATYYFKNSISGGLADSVISYGKAKDAVLTGDWDGDGKDTLVVRRGNEYYFKNSISGGTADKVIRYGRPTDTVLVGDWDGDGVDTLAVRRGNAYYFKNSIAGGTADRVITYGRTSDSVLVGDWDGDGSDSLAVRRGAAYYFKNSISGGVADRVIAYGKATDTVLAGDWDGDGIDSLVVRRTSTYYFKNSISGGQADTVVVYGKASDVVLVGNWDGR